MSEFESPHEEKFDYNLLNKLSESLGFRCKENLRSNAIKILTENQNSESFAQEVIDIMTEYQLKGEEIINSIKDDRERILALIGHQIDRISILIESNWPANFVVQEVNEVLLNINNEEDNLKEIVINGKNILEELKTIYKV